MGFRHLGIELSQTSQNAAMRRCHPPPPFFFIPQGECKHCGASLGRHAPFSSMKTKSRLFEEMSKISGYLPSNARGRSEGKARSREDKNGGAAQGSNSSVSTLRIRFLPLVVLSVLSCTFSEHYRKKSVDQRPPKSKAEFRTPTDDLLCVKEG